MEFLLNTLVLLLLGVLLLASNQEMANKLNKQFLSKEIKKVYVAITKGIPNPKEGKT